MIISATRISMATKFTQGRSGCSSLHAYEIQDRLRRSGEVIVEQLSKPELMMSHT